MILSFDGHLRYYSKINWELIHKYISVVNLKSSEGSIDTLQYDIVNQTKIANNNSIKIGLFHWYSPAVSIKEQADTICKMLDKCYNIKMVWIDVEQYGSNYKNDAPHFSPSEISSGVRALVDTLFLRTGIPIGIYWNPYFVQDRAKPMMDWIFDYPSWIASYIVAKPSDFTWENLPIPKEVRINWPSDWPEEKKIIPDIWQWLGDTYTLPGIFRSDGKKTTVDLDLLISDRIKKIYGIGGDMQLFYPVDEAKFAISQGFGENLQAYSSSKGHNGVDWATPVGSSVYAMEDGIVEISEDRKEKVGYGRQIRIRHAEGLSIYGHLTKRLVQVGESVKGGQLIGLTGGSIDDPYSGNSTGPHLHAEYRLNSGAPQVPGGYAYNAIDIYPLLVSKKEEEKALYKLNVLIDNLAVRRGPAKTFAEIRNAGKGIFPIYEEKKTQGEEFAYGRISQLESEWISLNSQYSEKITVEDVANDDMPNESETPTKAMTLRSLNIRTGAGISNPVLFAAPANTLLDILEIAYDSDKNKWIRCGYREWACVNFNGTQLLKI